MNLRYKSLIQAAAVIFAVSWTVELCFAALWTARTHPSAKASSDGYYAVYAAWTDKGGFGYAGRIYLVDRRRPIPRLYGTGYIVPADYGFLTDESFYIRQPDGRTVTFAISDFIVE